MNSPVNSATLETPTHSLWLHNFVDTYQNLNRDNLDKLSDIYHPSIEFIDPIHRIQGITELFSYFEHLYENLISSEFVLEDQIEQGEHAAIYWQMHLQHKKINGGNTITVTGHSHLRRQDGKVIYHRDYFDIGSMLYEHLPVLGGIIRLIKRKASDQ